MNLQFENVTVSVQKKTIVESISFHAASGCLTAITGPNGAGKSTLIDCLTGGRKYSGRILLNGRDLRSLSISERAASLACLPQQLSAPRVTVRELVSFGRAPYTPLTGRPGKADAAKVEEALEAVGMANFASVMVDRLSGGERQKAFFAMSLAQDTPVVLLDEPTAHLDAESRFAFLDLVRQMQLTTRKTFLVVMHDLPEVLQYADSIVTLFNRKIFFEGTPACFLEQQIPQRCFRVCASPSANGGYALRPVR